MKFHKLTWQNVASYYSNMLQFTELFRSTLLFPNMSMTWLDAWFHIYGNGSYWKTWIY